MSKVIGGIAPFGYRWVESELVIDEREAPIRRLMYELFIQHKRKKTVANLLNDLGHRTRSGSLFSDTTVGRLIKDTSAKGFREVEGKMIRVEACVGEDVWTYANQILEQKYPKRSTDLFTGIVYCGCGARMESPSDSAKYGCDRCKKRILKDDVEEIFHSYLRTVSLEDAKALADHWSRFSLKEKRLAIEQVCERMVIDGDAITIRLSLRFGEDSFKTNDERQQSPADDITPNPQPTLRPSESDHRNESILSEPLLSEAEAAVYLGIAKITLIRKRTAGQIDFFRVGHRILYSKVKHLVPYLENLGTNTAT